MNRCFTTALSVVMCLSSAAIALGHDAQQAVRVSLKGTVPAGRHPAVISVYATAEGGEPLASETRTVRVDANGAFLTPLGALASAGAGRDRWIGIRLGGAPEGRRTALRPDASPSIVIHVVPAAAITASGGPIESTDMGFRFPDGSVQTSAATVSGGVPSVNGIGAAVTIAGSGNASVSTNGSTITVNATGITGVTAGNGLTGGGSSGSPTISASFGNPVSVSTTNTQGSANTVARSDHVHYHGALAGGALHSVATTSTAGFLSAADKTKLDGTVDYVRTIVVSPGANAVASGNALRTALSGISSPSASNPYLVKIEPGTYDLGYSAITMRPFVDVEGSGESTTFITASCGSPSADSTAAAVIGAANSELRGLTIDNSAGGATNGMAIYSSVSMFRVRDVTIVSDDAFNAYGIYAAGGSLTLTRTTISASSMASGASGATAVRTGGSTLLTVLQSTLAAYGGGGTATHYGLNHGGTNASSMVQDSTISSSGAANVNYAVLVSGKLSIMNSVLRTANSGRAAATSASASASLEITGSKLTGEDFTVLDRGAGSTLRVATSLVGGYAYGSPTCVYVFNASYATTTCTEPIL